MSDEREGSYFAEQMTAGSASVSRANLRPTARCSVASGSELRSPRGALCDHEVGRYPELGGEGFTGRRFLDRHRRCPYRRYPLGEAAFVAEICNLIHANLKHNRVLECEVLRCWHPSQRSLKQTPIVLTLAPTPHT
jgi:hypothetical protein